MILQKCKTFYSSVKCLNAFVVRLEQAIQLKYISTETRTITFENLRNVKYSLKNKILLIQQYHQQRVKGVLDQATGEQFQNFGFKKTSGRESDRAIWIYEVLHWMRTKSMKVHQDIFFNVDEFGQCDSLPPVTVWKLTIVLRSAKKMSEKTQKFGNG